MSQTYESLVKKVAARGQAAKSASAKVAAGDTPTETDPRDKGTVSIPVDPNASAATMNLPASGTNTEVTPTYTAPAPAKTVDGAEKVAKTLQAKAAGVLEGIKALRKNASATASAITPTLVSDAGNDNRDTHPAPSTDNGPKHKQNPDPIAKTAAPSTAEPKDPTDKGKETVKGDSIGAIPAGDMNSNTTKVAGDIEFDPQFLQKLASTILSTEEGRETARCIIEKVHGAQEAEDIIKAAVFMEERAMQLEQLEDEGMAQADLMWKSASEEERTAIIKLANIHASIKATLETEMEKNAYDAGAAAGAQMQDQGMMGAEDPSAGGAAPGGAPGGDPSAAAGGGDEISDEDIMQVLQELVQSGKITEQDAEAIIQALSSGGGEGGAPGADGGAGGPPPDASAAGGPGGDPGAAAGGPPMPPEQKEAHEIFKSASLATDLLMKELNAAPAAVTK